MKQLTIAKKLKQILLFAFVFGIIISCGPSTKIEKSWREPTASVKADGTTKTLVVALVKDETSRRVIEDNLVKRMGANAVASYTFVSADMLKEANGDAFYEQLKKDKYSHVLITRLADMEKETSYVPGTTTGYYGGYGRYYGYGAGLYSTPGYYTTDKNYFVETMVYAVDSDKLLWSGTTKTVNPSKLDKAVTEIANVVSEQMRKDGFLIK